MTTTTSLKPPLQVRDIDNRSKYLTGIFFHSLDLNNALCKKVTVEILFNDPNKMGNVKPCEIFFFVLPIICIPLMSGKAQDLIREAVCMFLLL